MDSCAKGMPKCAPFGGCSKPEVEAGVGDITADASLGVDVATPSVDVDVSVPDVGAYGSPSLPSVEYSLREGVEDVECRAL